MEKEFVLGELILLETLPKYKNHPIKGKYRCFCGKTFIASLYKIKTKRTKSCGCYRKHWAAEKLYVDGRAKTRLFRIYNKIKQRIYNKNIPNYNRYGGRGITLYDEWQNFESFRDWSLNHGYADHLSIDRIDNDKGYSPENCRWILMKDQAKNKNKFENSQHPYKGIFKLKTISIIWGARIQADKIEYDLGYYTSPEEAAYAYNQGALKLHGEFANLNKLPIGFVRSDSCEQQVRDRLSKM